MFLSKVVNHDLRNNSVDNVYVDLNMYNNDITNEKATPINYKCYFSSPIVDDASTHYCQVLRFSVDTFGCIPNWIPQIQNTADPNLTIYSFTMNYVKAGVSLFHVQTFMEFSPQNKSLSPPSAPTLGGASEYYFIYGNKFVVELLNTTLSACFTALLALASTNSENLGTELAPFLLYDPTSSSLTFQADVNAFDTRSESDTRVEIYCNAPMYAMMSGFSYSQYNLPNGMSYRLEMVNDNNTNVIQMSDSVSVISMFEEYSSCTTWQACARIAFVSDDMPMNASIQMAPSVFGSQFNLSGNSSQRNTSMNILTDFEMIYDTATQIYPTVQYIPYKPRDIDLIGRNKIQSFTISVLWFDKYNNVYDMKIPVNGNASLKLCFKRKASVYNE